MKFARQIYPKISQFLNKGKVIIIFGARQVGKTTLAKVICQEHNGKFINCELPQYRSILMKHDIEALYALANNNNFLILDEAQTIENIGLLLKIMVDTYPQIQIIATGSSSFDLANKINEPLTGRSIAFMLYPLSIAEILSHHDKEQLKARLENLLIYGSYPDVFDQNNITAKTNLSSIAGNYLYKDILSFINLKKPRILEELLILLALQLGNEVSYHELAKNLKTSAATVENYIGLLEKTFVIFRLRSFSRNLRSEIAKSVKIYFYDCGVRNFIINNYNLLTLRNDKGALWENFCITERIKNHHNNMEYPNIYFWRTYEQNEIDLIEEKDGHLYAYEFKFSGNAKNRKISNFSNHYPNSSYKIINTDNFLEDFNNKI